MVIQSFNSFESLFVDSNTPSVVEIPTSSSNHISVDQNFAIIEDASDAQTPISVSIMTHIMGKI